MRNKKSSSIEVTAASASQIRKIRGSLKQVIDTFKSIDDYLYEDAGEAAMAKALGALATAERLTNGLRERLEEVT